MPTIGKIKAELWGDTRHFDRAMRRSGRRVDTLKEKFRGLRGAIVPLTGAFGFGRLIRSTFVETERMGQLAKRLDTSVESFSQLARVLRRSGIELNSTAMMMQRLQRRAADADTGNKQLAAAFDAIGINLKAFMNLDPVEGFLRVGEALAKIENPATRIQLAFKLLDSEGVQLLQANLPELRAEMEATTAVTERQAKAIEQLAADWSKVNDAVHSFMAQSWVDVKEGVPALLELLGRSLGIIDPPYETEKGAPMTGKIIGARPPRPTGIYGGNIGKSSLPGNRFEGGDLGPSNEIIAELRRIRQNTEAKGAVLE
jgi:hypothetical protein